LTALSDWIQIAQVLIAVALVYYAYVTIKEGKKNRRTARIERMLELIYLPIREILIRAREDEMEERAAIRRLPDKGEDYDLESAEDRRYVLTADELNKVRMLLERFGYYLNPDEMDTLRFDLNPNKVQEISPGISQSIYLSQPWYRLMTNVFDNHRRYFEEKCKTLTTELESMT
jgi:hypothetical protein